MTAGYMRFSAIFPWQRCRYPITGSHLTTVSPSSSSMSRRSPCIAGCCGPMFMSMVSSPNSSLISGLTRRLLGGSVSAPSCPARRSSPSIYLPQSLEGALCADLEALEQRVVVEVVLPHVCPPQIRMSRKSDPEHVVSLPLVPVGRGIDAGDRPDHRLITLNGRLDPDRAPTKVHELIRQLERALPIYNRDKREVRDAERLSRGREHGRNVSGARHDPHHVVQDFGLFQVMPVVETIEVALQPGPEIPLRKRHSHLGILLAVGAAVPGRANLRCLRLGFRRFPSLRLFLELL